MNNDDLEQAKAAWKARRTLAPTPPPTEAELQALQERLDERLKNTYLGTTMGPVRTEDGCGSVLRSGKARKGCSCKQCTEYREQRNIALQAKRDRMDLDKVEAWLAAPVGPAPITLRRVLGVRVNQWSNIDMLKQFWVSRGIDTEVCAYCQTGPFEQIEHIVPVARGGGSEFSNLLPSCKPCNSSKHAKDPWEWLTEHHPERLEVVRTYVYGGLI